MQWKRTMISTLFVIAPVGQSKGVDHHETKQQGKERPKILKKA